MVQTFADNRETPLADLFTGTFSYRIPIEVPPGRKGMAPGIGLTYRSNNSNGWVGVGWELEMGSIEHSIKGGVNYSGNKFVLRGPSGITELVNTSGNIYQAKIEGHFIQFVNQGSYWEATSKNGIKFRFGHDINTTLYDPNNFNLPNYSGNVFKWCLDRITDPNGNYITLSYSYDYNANGKPQQIYLSRIDFAGNSTASPNLLPTNYVQFDLEDRNDAPVLYTTNFAVKTAKRLKAVEVWASGALVRKYVLTYDAHTTGDGYSPLTERSVLGSITEYGSDGTSAKPPISLTYSNGYVMPNGASSGGWDGDRLQKSGPSAPLPVGMYCIPGEFNDGYDILCSTGTTGWDLKYLINNNAGLGVFLEWPNGLPPSLPSDSFGSRCITGDFKGEGKNSLACNFSNNGNWNMVFPGGPYDGNGNMVFPGGDPGEIWNTETWQNGPVPGLPVTSCFAGDFDGNGKTDIACYYAGAWHMALSSGTDFGSAPVQWTTGWYSAISVSSGECLTGDFNGDGKTDMACSSGGLNYAGWALQFSNGNGWDSINDLIVGPPSETLPVIDNCLAGDFNGDGKTDIACYSGGYWYVSLATGNTISGYERFALDNWSFSKVASGESAPIYNQCLKGDFNGDGKTDIACYNSGGNWTLYMSTGSGFNTYTWSGGPAPATSVHKQCFAADFNGDGKTDIACYISGNSWQVGYVYAPLTDFLTSIDNGLGSTVNIAYQPANSSGPNTQLPFFVQTVSGITVVDGNGNSSTSSYGYSGGNYNFAEKDFRGFNYAKVTGPAGPNGEQKITETWFHQGNDTAVDVNNPNVSTGYLKGKPYRTRVSGVMNGTTLTYSELETIYTDLSTGGYYFTPPYYVDTYTCAGGVSGACKGSANARQSETVYANYDVYGNALTVAQFGDINDPTDDRIITRSFRLQPGSLDRRPSRLRNRI